MEDESRCHLPGCPHGAECVHAKPAVSTAAVGLKDWTIKRFQGGEYMLSHPYWGAAMLNTEDDLVRVSVAAAFVRDYAKALGITD